MAFFDKEQPLGLPEGSVRSAIALSVVATFCIGFLKKMIGTEAFMGVVGSIITFYYMKMKSGNGGNGDVQPPTNPPA